jgi:hypothetical protein
LYIYEALWVGLVKVGGGESRAGQGRAGQVRAGQGKLLYVM